MREEGSDTEKKVCRKGLLQGDKVRTQVDMTRAGCSLRMGCPQPEKSQYCPIGQAFQRKSQVPLNL